MPTSYSKGNVTVTSEQYVLNSETIPSNRVAIEVGRDGPLTVSALGRTPIGSKCGWQRYFLSGSYSWTARVYSTSSRLIWLV
jgi:hypothetical protein